GSGKSSLIKILAGLLKASDWQATETLSSVTNSATLVSQKPFLFSASIRENLLYGHPTGFDDARLYQELEFVGLRSELAAMDQTLDSPIDFIQTALSGGQMQRLTIARALLREQPLLLMDEVTAAIDPLAEEALTRRLIERAHAENICLLFVTHRLQQLAYFDEIWFCEAGVLQIYRSVADMMHEPRLVRFIREFSSSNG
ncbi:MAG: ATP-binding cassette domain-containing protein, partial [Proteobacteria bacterium]|nr:ATP-binding cassette domain-containing protein [Pseudomonadota bacterium]